MTFQWTLVAYFLGAEIVTCFLLSIPLLRPRRWHFIFKLGVIQTIFMTLRYLVLGFSFLLLVLFYDAYKQTTKYSNPLKEEMDLKENFNMMENMRMKSFRAQRNLYISGFSLFLILVIYRLTSLLSLAARLELSNEALKKQAESASLVAENLIQSKDKVKKSESTSTLENLQEELKILKQGLADAHKADEKAQRDLLAMKSQAEAVNKEYDRLMKEHEELQKKLEGKPHKKDN